MSPDALNSFFSLCIGFALAGALASGYQALVRRPAGFGLLQEGGAPKTFAAVGILEPDVRHVFPDDAARRRIAGLKLSVLIAPLTSTASAPHQARGRLRLRTL